MGADTLLIKNKMKANPIHMRITSGYGASKIYAA